jgi:hypothetical protein
LRKPVTLLLLIVFCNSLFYYGYFSISLLKAKLEAKIALAKMGPQAGSPTMSPQAGSPTIGPQAGSDIIKVPVCQLQKDEKDEVWYNDNLYDVVERDRINDTIYVFLLRDEQEQHVLAGNQKYFQNSCGVLADGEHEFTVIKKVPTIIDTEHLTNYMVTFSQRDCLAGSAPVAGKSPLSAVCAEIPSPPPRRA